MEFIKLNKNRYLIKDSNNLVVSEEEMLKLQKKELIIKDIQSNVYVHEPNVNENLYMELLQ